MLIVASESEHPGGSPTWGSGGWLPPEDREALDWLMLARLSGWEAVVQTPSEQLAASERWVVVACDPGELTAAQVEALRRRLDRPVLVVARAGREEAPLSALAGAIRGETSRGTAIRWQGPCGEREWRAAVELETALRPVAADCEMWATIDGTPLVCARRVGAGIVATLGFHPSRARDEDGAATALLRRLLVAGALGPVAWLDLEHTLVLRMDDPGGAQNVHWSEWSYPKLTEPDWALIGAELRRHDARLSVLYTPGWVDDGEAERGSLLVDGRPPARVPGSVWDSHRVQYEDVAGHAPGTIQDYRSEWRGISSLRASGLGDPELHGHTHLHPDLGAWAAASDRYDARGWYRDLGRNAADAIAARAPAEHPLELGLEAFERVFGTTPTTLVPPGDDFHDADVEAALRLGFRLFASYYLAVRDHDRFCWSQHVCAPYLHRADPSWFAAGLPVIGYFHDNDIALGGVEWLRQHLDAWREAGAERMIDFRELAAAVGRRLSLDVVGGEPVLSIASDGAPALVRPLRVRLLLPGGGSRATVRIVQDGGDFTLEAACADETLVLEVPVAASPRHPGRLGVRPE
jgi:hypothetical protein